MDARGPYMSTYSGGRYYHAAPLPEDIFAADLAHHLSLICRFTGACKQHYSVAEHSVRVSFLCPEPYQLRGLLHDGAEAYCNDLSRPLKYNQGMESYQRYEKLGQATVYERFGLPEDHVADASIKEADNILLVTEKRDLFLTPDGKWAFNKTDGVNGVQPLPETIVPWTPQEAEERFMLRLHALYTPNVRYHQ